MPEPLIFPSSASPSDGPDTKEKHPSCGCSGKNSLTRVYAIGNLSYDFVSIGVRNGIQDRMKSLRSDKLLPENEVQLLQHLFQFNSEGGEENESNARTKLNIPEARRVSWVLQYGGIPQYILVPSADHDLTNLIFDFAEEIGLADDQRKTLFGKPRLSKEKKPTYFGVAGYATGKFMSIIGTDRPVEILIPEYDLTDSWNIDALIEDAKKDGLIPQGDPSAERQFKRTVRQLHAQIDPKGQTSQSRAVNYLIAHSATLAEQALLNQYKDGFVFVGISVVEAIDSLHDADEAIQITARYIDMNDPRNIPYEQKITINVANPKPYYGFASEIGFGNVLSN